MTPTTAIGPHGRQAVTDATRHPQAGTKESAMTRKDYELLAKVFAATRPVVEDFTKTSAVGDNTFVDNISFTAAYAAWERTIRSNALENDNPRFDRGLFQFAATQSARAGVWLVDYRYSVPAQVEAEMLATSAALRDVPLATVNIIRSRLTPKGTWVITVKRTRKEGSE